MNTKQKKRITIILSLIFILSIATGLVLYALKQNINLFYTPSQLMTAKVNPDQHVRVGGYVKKGSVHYHSNGESVIFTITDRSHEMDIKFNGVLPNLFREGQTVVVTGTIAPGFTLLAQEVLAKHDEKYMPKPLRNLQKGNGYGA